MHPEREHALQIELATALRERDDAREAARDLLNGTARAESERDALRADVKRLRERDDAARAMLTQLRAALEEDSTFLGAVLRVEMDKWLATGGDRG